MVCDVQLFIAKCNELVCFDFTCYPACAAAVFCVYSLNLVGSFFSEKLYGFLPMLVYNSMLSCDQLQLSLFA